MAGRRLPSHVVFLVLVLGVDWYLVTGRIGYFFPLILATALGYPGGYLAMLWMAERSRWSLAVGRQPRQWALAALYLGAGASLALLLTALVCQGTRLPEPYESLVSVEAYRLMPLGFGMMVLTPILVALASTTGPPRPRDLAVVAGAMAASLASAVAVQAWSWGGKPIGEFVQLCLVPMVLLVPGYVHGLMVGATVWWLVECVAGPSGSEEG